MFCISTRKLTTGLHDRRQLRARCGCKLMAVTHHSMWQVSILIQHGEGEPRGKYSLQELLSAHPASSLSQSRSGGPGGQCTKYEPALCPSNTIPGHISRNLAGRERQEIITWHLLENILEYCVQFWACSTRKMSINCRELRWLEHSCCEEKKKMSLLSLVNRRHWDFPVPTRSQATEGWWQNNETQWS